LQYHPVVCENFARIMLPPSYVWIRRARLKPLNQMVVSNGFACPEPDEGDHRPHDPEYRGCFLEESGNFAVEFEF